MKRVLTLYLFVFVCWSCGQRNSFVLEGILQECKDGDVLYLVEDYNRQSVCDSVIVQNGRFCFKGELSRPLRVLLTPNIESHQGVVLYIEPGKMEFTGSLEDPYRFMLTNSASNDEYLSYWKQLLPVLEEAILLQQQVATSEEKQVAREKLMILQQKNMALDREFMNRPNSLFASYLLKNNLQRMTLEEIEACFNRMSGEVRQTPEGQYVARYIERGEELKPGKLAPAIESVDIDGVPFSLNSLQGKYVILDFWASWCVPCRQGNPHLIELYNKYHEKGLEIVCVADNDGQEAAWRKAVDDDGIRMFHHILCGRKRTDTGVDSSTAVSEKYNIHYLPTRFLIDAEGKIVGKLTEQEIDTKLVEIFGF